MVALRYVVLLITGVGVGVGFVLRDDTVLTRASVAAGVLIGLADIVVLFAPDLFTGLARGDPWWGFAEAAVFAVVLGAVWIGLATTAISLGAFIGRAMGRRAHRPARSP